MKQIHGIGIKTPKLPIAQLKIYSDSYVPRLKKIRKISRRWCFNWAMKSVGQKLSNSALGYICDIPNTLWYPFLSSFA